MTIIVETWNGSELLFGVTTVTHFRINSPHFVFMAGYMIKLLLEKIGSIICLISLIVCILWRLISVFTVCQLPFRGHHTKLCQYKSLSKLRLAENALVEMAHVKFKDGCSDYCKPIIVYNVHTVVLASVLRRYYIILYFF